MGSNDWVRAQRASFNIADENQDGELNGTEFFNFLHPEESKNPKLLHHLAREDLRDRDVNKDGKLSFKEFSATLWHDIKPSAEVDDDGKQQDPPDEDQDVVNKRAKSRFKELDMDHNGFLDSSEMIVTVPILHPSEKTYARQQAGYAFGAADENHDGKLSLTEMQTNSHVFYAAVEEDGGYSVRDEFKK